jgi:hypothetical protein
VARAPSRQLSRSTKAAPRSPWPSRTACRPSARVDQHGRLGLRVPELVSVPR